MAETRYNVIFSGELAEGQRRPHLHFWAYKAFDGYKRQSLPILFKASEGTGLTLEQGQIYTAE